MNLFNWLSVLLILSVQLRAFTDSRDDLSLGHVVVLLQYDWPQGEMLFLKAIEKICQQGSFQYENFFNYVTSILLSPKWSMEVKVSWINKGRQISSFVVAVSFHELMVAVRHWHAGGVCISAHSRRGKDSAGAAAQPGNVDQVSPSFQKPLDRHGDFAHTRSVAVCQENRGLNWWCSRHGLWGTLC